MHGAQPLHLPMIALLSGAITLFALYRFFVRLRRDRVVADTPLMHLRSAAQGYVKVSGRTSPVATAPTAAPLSGRPCVWWNYAIARQERDSRGRVQWRTTESAASVELFALTDEDGASCLVGPVRAEVTPTVSNVWYGMLPRPVGPPPASSPLFGLGLGDWRYTERLVGVGERLCVLGELRSHSELGDANAATMARLHEWKQDQKTLLARFDLDHDGMLNAAEWEAARQAAAHEAQAQVLGSHITRTSVISEPTNGEPFLIAPLEPTQLERRERLRATLDFAVGLLAVIVFAWALRHGG
jgi:hypothetical protein